MNIQEARAALNNKTKKLKATAKTPGIGWEVGAYAVRTASVVTPATIIMAIENSWLKNSLGLMATFMIIAVLIVFRKPIREASNYAPGVIVFSIFAVIAILFQTVAGVLLTVGLSGLGGSVVAIPLHLKYLSYKKQEKSPELLAIEDIANNLKK